MKASTAASSSSNVSSHKSAMSCPLPPPSLFLYTQNRYFLSKNVLPLIRHVVSYLLSYHLALVFSISPLVLRPTPSPLFTRVPSGIFLSFVLKMLRLPRGRYLGQVGPGRATPDQEVGRYPMEPLYIIMHTSANGGYSAEAVAA